MKKTADELRESILGRLKSLLSKGKKPSKSIEKKISSDAQLKQLYKNLQKSSAKTQKIVNKLIDKYPELG